MSCFIERWFEEAYGWVPAMYCDRVRVIDEVDSVQTAYGAVAVLRGDARFDYGAPTCATNYDDVTCALCRHFFEYDVHHIAAARELRRPVKVGDFIHFIPLLTEKEVQQALKGEEGSLYAETGIIREFKSEHIVVYYSKPNSFVKLLLADRCVDGPVFKGRVAFDDDDDAPTRWTKKQYKLPDGYRAGLWHNYL